MHKLYLLILVHVIFFSQLSYAQEEVTFQGAIERGAGTLESEVVSGFIEFISSGDSETRHTTPFTIPANNSRVAYEYTIPWSFADTGSGAINVTITCTINCEVNNISTNTMYYLESGETYVKPFKTDQNGNTFRKENFGQDTRDDAYIVNLSLFRENSIVSGVIELPDNMIASSDITIQAYVNYLIVPGYNWTLFRTSKEITIEQGNSQVVFRIPVDLDSYSIHSFAIGYSCKTDACSEHGLIERGVVSDANADYILESLTMSTALTSHYYKAHYRTDFDQTGQYSLPIPMTLFKNISLPIKIKRKQHQASSGVIKGRVIVYKNQNDILCGQFNGPYFWDGVGPCADATISLVDSIAGLVKKVISETEFQIGLNSSEEIVDIIVEPVEQYLAPDDEIVDVKSVDSQYISFVCDEGCDDFDPDQAGYYLGGTRTTSGLREGGAHQFYLTEEFYQNEIVINLARVTAMPWVENLLNDKTAPSANIDD